MKKELDSRLIIGLIAVLVIIVGVVGWRMFAPRSGGDNLSPQEAGLGKPMYPAGSGQTPAAPTGP